MLEIIRKHDENTTLNQKQFAESLGNPSSTLRTIIKSRDSIFEAATGGMKRKKVKSGKYEDIETILLEWIHQSWDASVPISWTIIQEKAREIAGKLNKEFSASNGWLDRFKQGHGIVYQKINGKSESVTLMLVHGQVRFYQDSFSMNLETSLIRMSVVCFLNSYWTNLSCHGVKLSKERVTVLVGANSDSSEKLPLLMIGKSAKPRCFKNIKKLPCVYK